MEAVLAKLDFSRIKSAVEFQFEEMTKLDLFKTDVSKEELWDTYMDSFPEGTNQVYRERRDHDCQKCKQFIRTVGNVVAIVDGRLISIWDITVGGDYQIVVDSLSQLVKSRKIRDVFLSSEKKIGMDHNTEENNGVPIKWHHFYMNLPKKHVKRGAEIGTLLGDLRANKEVFQRGLDEIKVEAIETVLELIAQNSLYRGKEHESIVKLFLEQKNIYDTLKDSEKDNHCWKTSMKLKSVSKIRNTVIGTLLTDLSEDMPLDTAVKAFETKTAPANYKRPTALVTKGMIDKAEKKVAELEIGDSLLRRYAVVDDITINNVIFANREVKKTMNVFDELKGEVADKKPNLKKVEEVDIDTFVKDILPKAEKIELFLCNSHEGNLVSLIAPKNIDAKRIFKWDNNFSWSYKGEVTDSIKERVKKAGGSVTGDLRCSLSWFNFDDLDLHMKGPDGTHISYGNKCPRGQYGKLDVDMNAGHGDTRNAVENITYENKSTMKVGKYKLFVNNYCKRENKDVGFVVEMEFEGKIRTFNYNKAVGDGKDVTVIEFEYSQKDGIQIISSLSSTESTREIWNVPTQKYHNVSMIMNSPNYWDGNSVGNKHWFFMIENCKNPDTSRGFYNEFLSNELTEHRKVFEVLGSKMKVAKDKYQLSGLGFSSTQKNSVICRVSGSFNRDLKINF